MTEQVSPGPVYQSPHSPGAPCPGAVKAPKYSADGFGDGGGEGNRVVADVDQRVLQR